jgi:hypothetical protein
MLFFNTRAASGVQTFFAVATAAAGSQSWSEPGPPVLLRAIRTRVYRSPRSSIIDERRQLPTDAPAGSARPLAAQSDD